MALFDAAAGSDAAGSDAAGSDHAGSDHAGSDHAGSDHALLVAARIVPATLRANARTGTLPTLLRGIVSTRASRTTAGGGTDAGLPQRIAGRTAR
jgi:hypothetical protein